ncbi:eukaryotic translation initiation factor 4E-binding protein isoform X2 [Bacillus rossius redtenbacheri]|uniref:eukaryotic translation initiation factor 4E-binding protein isoform X2 n=1 Tax=Bacillus rossius redtenbacheri TaxID=93214 RepID=UPI002FDDEF4C
MSASPIARQATHSQSIPSRRVVLNDASQLPADYSCTPGGTLYSTTPGGTRIVYERAFLMNLRNSPLARTPPSDITSFPSNLLKGAPDAPDAPDAPLKEPHVATPPKTEPVPEEIQDQFQLEI